MWLSPSFPSVWILYGAQLSSWWEAVPLGMGQDLVYLRSLDSRPCWCLLGVTIPMMQQRTNRA